MQLGIALCSRAGYTPPAAAQGAAIVYADSRRPRGQLKEFILCAACPYCGEQGHAHLVRGLQQATCGRGEYFVRWSGAKIHVFE